MKSHFIYFPPETARSGFGDPKNPQLKEPSIVKVSNFELLSALQETVRSALTELELRTRVMELLINHVEDSQSRKNYLRRSVNQWRNKRALVKSLETRVKEALEEAGALGLPLEEVGKLFGSKSTPEVSEILKRVGVEVKGERMRLQKFAETVEKAEKEQVPVRESREVKAPPDQDDPRTDPIGTRRLWNKRIVEKKPDGRWHVVSHIAGLEDPAPVPQLSSEMLNREQLLMLMEQLLQIHQIQNGVDPLDEKEKKQ